MAAAVEPSISQYWGIWKDETTPGRHFVMPVILSCAVLYERTGVRGAGAWTTIIVLHSSTVALPLL